MFQVFVRDDLVQVGVTEDGEADIARRFYVVFEANDGSRYSHREGRLNVVRCFDEEEGLVFYRQDDGAAERFAIGLAARVRAAVAAGRRLDLECWDELDPAYGSEAYQGLDAVGYFRARERAEAHYSGEAGVGFGSEVADLIFA